MQHTIFHLIYLIIYFTSVSNQIIDLRAYTYIH